MIIKKKQGNMMMHRERKEKGKCGKCPRQNIENLRQCMGHGRGSKPLRRTSAMLDPSSPRTRRAI